MTERNSSTAPETSATPRRIPRIVVVGAGWVAKAWHGPVLAAVERAGRCEVVAVCDPRAEAAQALAKLFAHSQACAAWTDVPREAFDTVYVLVPPAAMEAVAIPVLQTGLDVFMEKPPGLSAPQAEALHAAATEAGARVFVAFNRRHSALTRGLAEQADFLACPAEQKLLISGELIRVNRRDADFATTAIHAIDLIAQLGGADHAEVDITSRADAIGPALFHLAGRLQNGVPWRLLVAPRGGEVAERYRIHASDRFWQLDVPTGPGESGGAALVVGGATTWSLDTSGSGADHDPNGFAAETNLFLRHLADPRAAFNGHDIASAFSAMRVADALRTVPPR